MWLSLGEVILPIVPMPKFSQRVSLPQLHVYSCLIAYCTNYLPLVHGDRVEVAGEAVGKAGGV